MHQIFIMSTGIIFATELGPVLVQGGRVYFSSLTFFLLVSHFSCYDCHETKINNKTHQTDFQSQS